MEKQAKVHPVLQLGDMPAKLKLAGFTGHLHLLHCPMCTFSGVNGWLADGPAEPRAATKMLESTLIWQEIQKDVEHGIRGAKTRRKEAEDKNGIRHLNEAVDSETAVSVDPMHTLHLGVLRHVLRELLNLFDHDGALIFLFRDALHGITQHLPSQARIYGLGAADIKRDGKDKKASELERRLQERTS